MRRHGDLFGQICSFGTFIHDSYANRLGKGTHRALDRCTFFCRRARFVLKCDVEKFFPFLVFGDDKLELRALLEQIRSFLRDYRLSLHSRKCVVIRTRDGVPFLGWQVFPDHRRLKRATGVGFQRRLRELQQLHRAGEIEQERVRASVMSWVGHLKHGDTWGLRRKLLHGAVFLGGPKC